MEYGFKTKELSVGYDGNALLSEINMEIKRGEIITLIGPNGSGKSTLLKSMTKHLETIAGVIWIGEDSLQKMTNQSLSKKVSVVLTEKIHPELMTCREVVSMGRYPYTGRLGILSAEDERIVDDVMEEIGILELAQTEFRAISDGQKQRVLLGRALCQQPEIIVLDEPTSYLDVRYKVELVEILKKMAKEKKTTVLMSLHEIDLALKISDRLICVDGKRVCFFGTPKELLEDQKIYDLYHIKPEVYRQYFGSLGIEEDYIYKSNQKLRKGFTTGSCAAAATKAAVQMLFEQKDIKAVSIRTPKGVMLNLLIEEIEREKSCVKCAVRKDAGDDPDCTNGILIYAKVSKQKSGIVIEGGKGIGRVTKPGLDQPVGEAAINQTPRKMIKDILEEAMDQYDYAEGFSVEISAPEGEELAKRTFNPKLGIEGGISILGTSGIVEPMSEQALIETIRTEMKMKTFGAKKQLLVTPGNYGKDFLLQNYGIDVEKSVKCSNFIGETIDMAYEFQVESMLLVGHIGKLVKVAAGIMNTHSKMADGRMDVICTSAMLCGATTHMCQELFSCVTTDAALALLEKWGLLNACMGQIVSRIYKQVNQRAWEKLQVEVILFSNEYGVLGESPHAREFLQWFREDI